MSNLEISLTGQAEVARALRLLGDKAPAAMGKALFKEATEIMNAAKGLTPVDTGTLKASGHVALPEVNGDEVTVKMGFGGAASDYAIHVHEDMEASHKPPTQAKYLEQPLMEASQNGMAERIAQTLQQEFK